MPDGSQIPGDVSCGRASGSKGIPAIVGMKAGVAVALAESTGAANQPRALPPPEARTRPGQPTANQPGAHLRTCTEVTTEAPHCPRLCFRARRPNGGRKGAAEAE